jgi:hypothetical protein
MIREFLYRAYLVAFAGSVIFGSSIVWSGGFFEVIQIALVITVFWLIVGWVCAPFFKKK